MAETLSALEQVLKTVDQLEPGELELLHRKIEHSHRQKNKLVARDFPTPAVELFKISFAHYLSLTDKQRDALAFEAYKILDDWIERELKVRRAQWMLVCGGEILEFSSNLLNYPASDKLMEVGHKRGLIPFVFIRTPIIEESKWSILSEDDYYPTLQISVGKFGLSMSRFKSSSTMVTADFDTGASHLLLDDDDMIANGVISRTTLQQAHYRPHLGEYYSCYLLPVTLAIKNQRGRILIKEFGTVPVRDWRQSPLCLVNPERRALAGRNLLLAFPLRVELDGESKHTRVLGRPITRKKSPKGK